MFSLQHRKAKTIWEMFISIILFYDGIFVLAKCMPKYVNTCQLICNMLYFRHSAYVVKADVIAFGYMADVIAIFSYVILLHIGQMLGPYLLLYNTG